MDNLTGRITDVEGSFCQKIIFVGRVAASYSTVVGLTFKLAGLTFADNGCGKRVELGGKWSGNKL